MLQAIIGFHLDDDEHWVARLVCGHNQHVRHDPPWTNRPWVTKCVSREKMLGYKLDCLKCERKEVTDWC